MEINPLESATPVSGPDAPPEIETYGRSEFFSASAFEGSDPPTREWIVPGLIPRGTATLFSGDGGTGKSLAALQLSTAVSAGRLWLGVDVYKGKSVFITAEDSRDELHRRMDAIRAADNDQPWAGYRNCLLRSLLGEDALLCEQDRKSGKLMRTGLWLEIYNKILSEPPDLVVLDTAADLFGGNENDRAQVRQFIQMLNKLADEADCAVVLLSHPSVAGMSSGSGLSGSTAWSNSVRSRLYLERVINEGYEPDPDCRILSTKKANYGRTGTEIKILWRNGAFVPTAQNNDGDTSPMAQRVFLKLLGEYTSQGRYVSHQPGPTYAPAQFERNDGAEGVTKSALVRAMNALFKDEIIRIGEHGKGAKARSHIERCK